MKEFANAALASESLKKYDGIIRDMAEIGGKISFKNICMKRNEYANRIIKEIGLKDAKHSDAFEYSHKIVTLIDMIRLENLAWIDDIDE